MYAIFMRKIKILNVINFAHFCAKFITKQKR